MSSGAAGCSSVEVDQTYENSGKFSSPDTDLSESLRDRYVGIAGN